MPFVVCMRAQVWWCLRLPCLRRLSPTPCGWQHRSRPSSTSRPYSWWGRAHSMLSFKHDYSFFLHCLFAPPPTSTFPYSLSHQPFQPCAHMSSLLLLCRPSRWRCRRWICPSSRPRSSRGSRRSRRWSSIGGRRSSGGISLSDGPWIARPPHYLHLPRPHLPGPKRQRLNAPAATSRLSQR